MSLGTVKRRLVAPGTLFALCRMSWTRRGEAGTAALGEALDAVIRHLTAGPASHAGGSAERCREETGDEQRYRLVPTVENKVAKSGTLGTLTRVYTAESRASLAAGPDRRDETMWTIHASVSE